MPEFFDYNPLTGVRRSFDYDDDTGKAYIRSVQDVEPLLDHALELRNTGACDAVSAKTGRKMEMRLWAVIPPIVQMELLGKGINMFSSDPTELKRFRLEIERNYAYLKTTDMKNV